MYRESDLMGKIDVFYQYSVNQNAQYTNEYKALLEPLKNTSKLNEKALKPL